MASHVATPATSPISSNDNSNPEFIIPNSSHFSRCSGPVLQAPCTSYDLRDIAKIFVFEDHVEEIYDIPRGLLRWHSSYFAAALDPDSEIGMKVGKLRLQEDHEVFDAFVCWLWTGKLKDVPESLADATANDFYLDPMLLCKIWVFGDMRGVPGLCNAAIDMLHERSTASRKIPQHCIPWIYANTTSGTKLRMYIVDACTLNMRSSWWHDLDDQSWEIPAQFLVDALPALISRGLTTKPISNKAWEAIDRCHWHDHSGPGGKLRIESRK